jgi:enterobactin C-glucosyltransferase
VRVLLVGAPFFGLLFPVVPLAHAFRAAGHDVLLATCGSAAVEAAHAGFTVLDCAPDADVAGFFRFVGDKGPGAPGAVAFFGVAMAERLVEAGRRWRPDLVVHVPHALVGGLAATALGVPSVVHGLGWMHTPELMAQMGDGLLADCAHLGVTELAPPAAWLDIAPPSTRTVDATGRLDLRPVPYNGGGVLPEWLLTPPDRPRVVVTVGTVRPELPGGLRGLDWLADAGDLDAEFVLALGPAAARLTALPPNTRATGWVPLGALLATASAVVHHGGAGTTLTATVAGLPQLIFPGGADQPVNAEALARRGAALNVRSVTLADITRLLGDESLRTAARDVQAEVRTMPSPAQVANTLAELFG